MAYRFIIAAEAAEYCIICGHCQRRFSTFAVISVFRHVLLKRIVSSWWNCESSPGASFGYRQLMEAIFAFGCNMTDT